MPSDSAASPIDPVRANARRSITPEWLSPFDTVPAYLSRARAAAAVSHPNLNPPAEVGTDPDEPIVIVESIDGADLQSLIDDIGPMPVLLAAEYARQAASGLAAAHAAGIIHGDVRPIHLIVGPLVPMSKPRADGSPRFRPGPTAAVRVNELGLIPRRAKAKDWPAEWDRSYLPPERFEVADPTPAGDVAMLGGVLEFLLTGQPPGTGTLAAHRPDTSADLVAVVQQMRAPDPAARPTMANAANQLEQVIQAAKAPAASVPNPEAFHLSSGDGELSAPVAPPTGWTVQPVAPGQHPTVTPPTWVAPPSDEPLATTYRRTDAGMSRRTVWSLLAAFVVMNLLAVAIWLLVLAK